MQRFRFSHVPALAICVTAMLFGIQTSAKAATTVLDMPPPPKIVTKQQPRDLEAEETSAAIVTTLDRARAADLAGSNRSYLGVVAFTRYATYRHSPRYSYYSYSHRYGYYGNSHYGHYPFDVSFLHGVPINCGYPTFSFHWGHKNRFCF